MTTLKAHLKDASLFIQSGWLDNKPYKAGSGETMSIIDPATGKEMGTVPDMNVDDLRKMIDSTYSAFESWNSAGPKKRSDILRRFYDLCVENTDDLAAIVTAENGKSLVEAKAEVAYGVTFLDWFSGEATRQYGDFVPTANTSLRSVVIRQPIGAVGIITPWNFPIAMITRKLGAAIAAGCPVVVKPAPETPFSCLALAELAKRAGVPHGVFNVVTTMKHTQEIGKELCTSRKIKKISFTGSTAVGRLLMQLCASADDIKKVSMELGGNAPFIIFDDADLSKAIDAFIVCKFRATGQTCISANRVFVQSGIHDRFLSALREKMASFRMGSGFDKDVMYGPLIHVKAVEKVQRLVSDAETKGAKVVMGGKRPQGQGAFYEPTILENVNDKMDLWREEMFGPVVSAIKFNTEEEVLKMANDTPHGLAAYFFSQDVGRCWRMGEKLEAGMVGINNGMLSGTEIPFGGIKNSGGESLLEANGITHLIHSRSRGLQIRIERVYSDEVVVFCSVTSDIQ